MKDAIKKVMLISWLMFKIVIGFTLIICTGPIGIAIVGIYCGLKYRSYRKRKGLPNLEDVIGGKK